MRRMKTEGVLSSFPFGKVEPKKFKVPDSLKQSDLSDSSNFDESFMNFDAIAAVS